MESGINESRRDFLSDKLSTSLEGGELGRTSNNVGETAATFSVVFFFECETRLFGRLGSLAYSSLVSHSLSNRNSRTGVGFGLLLRYRVEDRKRVLGKQKQKQLYPKGHLQLAYPIVPHKT
jgi:hypothetical protein